VKHRKTIKKKARFISYRKLPADFISYNFSDVEDGENAIQLIGALAKTAFKNAAAEAKAAGLACTYVRGNRELAKVSADGTVTPISATIQRASFYVKYKPGTVLHAVKRWQALYHEARAVFNCGAFWPAGWRLSIVRWLKPVFRGKAFCPDTGLTKGQ
jgi:hypothetical protein